MADITNDIAALRAALPGLKGWGLERVEPCPEDDGQAEVGTSFDDGGFAPVITVDTGLYYANDRAMPLARAVSVACVAAPALLAELDRLTAALQAAQAEAAALREDAERAKQEAASWRTRGRGLMLQDPELAEDMAALKARIESDPEYARQLMVETGIWNSDGSLTPEYGGNIDAAREVKHG